MAFEERKNRILSIIIPVFNEQDNILPLYEELVNILDSKMKVGFDVLFVDDGSNDDSWTIIRDLRKKDNRVTGIRLSRNFGHQAALWAGLEISNGDAFVTIDADLQQPVYLIEEFYKSWIQGNDIVYGVRKRTKGVSIFKRVSSWAFYNFLNFISDDKIQQGSSDFRLLDSRVVDQLRNYGESDLFIRGTIKWFGYKSKGIEYTAGTRLMGSSKYSFRKMVSLAIDGVLSSTTKPLRLATGLGLLVSAFSFVYIVYSFLAKFYFQAVVPGWTSIIISVLFLGGVQLIAIGILGEYIGRLYWRSKNRPAYIIADKL